MLLSLAALALASPPAVEQVLCADRGQVVVLHTARDLLRGFDEQRAERRVLYPDGEYRTQEVRAAPAPESSPWQAQGAWELHAAALARHHEAALAWCHDAGLEPVQELSVRPARDCVFAECLPGEGDGAGSFALGELRLDVQLRVDGPETTVALALEGDDSGPVVARWSPEEVQLDRGRRARLDPARLRRAFLTRDGLSLGLELSSVVPVHAELGAERRVVWVPVTALAEALGFAPDALLRESLDL